jgi:thiamine pyrophosphate-dependent acetolactate synthase large subunit-like protein
VTEIQDLVPALQRALECGLPACVNVEIDSHAAPVFVRGGAIPTGAR